MVYGLTTENRNLIITKAAAKADGVYCFRGVVYRVVDGKVTHYAWGGNIVQGAGHFDVRVGSYNGYTADATRLLKSIR